MEKVNPKMQLIAFADDLNDYRQFIFDHVSFVEVLKRFNLRSEECSTGKYTHRMICPFLFHKNGKERTASFRFNDKTKKFSCYGCNEGGDVLDFLRLFNGGYDQFNLRKLAVMAGLIEDNKIKLPENFIISEACPQKETNYKVFFDSGILLRQYLLGLIDKDIYLEECEWADQMLIKVDKYFSLIDEENIKDAQKIYNKLNRAIEKRIVKK